MVVHLADSSASNSFHSRILFFLSRVTFQLLNSSRSLLLWSSGLLFCKTSGPFSAPVTTRRRYRGQFRVHQESSHATVFATSLVYFSSSRFWTARLANSRRSKLVCRCLKPLAHLLLPSQDSRTFYPARDQLFLSTATWRLHLFWCWLILYFQSFLSFRVSCPCSFLDVFIQRLLHHAFAESTHRNIKSYVNVYTRFCNSVACSPSPVEVDTLSKRTFGTIIDHLRSIKHVNQPLGFNRVWDTGWGGGGTLHIRASKTLQFQQRSLTIPLPGIPGSPLCPVAALQSHLRFSSGHAHSPLFSVISLTSQRLIPITYRHFVLFFLQPSAR